MYVCCWTPAPLHHRTFKQPAHIVSTIHLTIKSSFSNMIHSVLFHTTPPPSHLCSEQTEDLCTMFFWFAGFLPTQHTVHGKHLWVWRIYCPSAVVPLFQPTITTAPIAQNYPHFTSAIKAFRLKASLDEQCVRLGKVAVAK